MKQEIALKHEFVEFIPGELKEGMIYVSIRFGTASHLCVCGCGNKVVTPIRPTDWKLIFDGKTISLDYSIDELLQRVWAECSSFLDMSIASIALYNPASKARPHQLGQAFNLLRTIKSPQTVVLFVQKAATPETRVIVATLAEADPALADMRTLVIIGATATRLIPRAGQRPWVYTPRAETGIAR